METNEIQNVEQPRVEIMQVNSGETLAALNRSEIDVQIATAKQYPRNLAQVLNNIETLATLDEETAESCFYVLRRQGKVIEGPSVRFAEIVASSYGNIRVATRIISNDGKKIVAQGICHDLESNYAVSSDVTRRITNKNGQTFSEDMQVVTGNAAMAIAMRNAIFKVVPSAVFKRIIAKAKQVSLGQSLSLQEMRSKMMSYFKTIGVEEKQIFDYLSVTKLEEINIDMVVELRGLANAIKEGTTSVEETFAKTDEETAKKVAEKFKDFDATISDGNSEDKK